MPTQNGFTVMRDKAYPIFFQTTN